MNERPWQSNLWREVYSVPKQQDPVQAYFKLKGGEVVRGEAVTEDRYKGTRGEICVTQFVDLDGNTLKEVTAWQPVLGLMNKSPADRLPFDEELFTDLVTPHTWQAMYHAPTDGSPVWILTTHGNLELARSYRDDKNRVFWGPDEGCRLSAVAWHTVDEGLTPPKRPERKTNAWRVTEQEAQPVESDEPVTVVINADRDLHLRLPNGPWRHKSYLPQRLAEGDEDLRGELVWALQLDGSIVQAKATRDPSGKLRWIAEGPEDHTVAWRPYVSGDLNLELPLLYHGATNSPVSWKTLLEWGELKGPGAYPPAMDKQPAHGLSWLADLLEHIVPPLAKAFREEPPAKTERAFSQPLTIPQFTHDVPLRPTAEDVNRHLHEELKEIGKAIEDDKQDSPSGIILPKGTIPPTAAPEPVEKSPVDNRDWTQGMYKTANDYDVPPIPGYDETCRDHHEGVVRFVLRDLIREKTRDQTLDDYMDAFTPMEFFILQGLATGQEHFVDTKGLAAFNYDRLYRSGFITRISVTFGPRLDRATRQGMGGGGSARNNVPMDAYCGGSSGYELWELTPLGQQFMAYLLARDNKRHVAKNHLDQSK